jgi:hypothetical protein
LLHELLHHCFLPVLLILQIHLACLKNEYKVFKSFGGGLMLLVIAVKLCICQ